MMKHILLSLGLISGAAYAQTVSPLHISDLDITREGEKLVVKMSFNPKEYHLGLNQQIVVTPVLTGVDKTKTVQMPSFAIAGKNNYYHTLRNDGEEAAASLYRAGKGEKVVYEYVLDWQPWMEQSQFDYVTTTKGCCGAAKSQEDIPAARLDFTPREYVADFTYIAPVATEVKTFDLTGQAFINFPVNKTEIYPDYMTNPVELRKILDTIDAVKENTDATVSHIKLTGYASPEGPYANNVRLAKGRTEALKEYVRNQYTFPANIFETASVPEDWDGLRASLVDGPAKVLTNASEIVAFIDQNTPIESRNDELRKKWPTDYAWLLKNVYPSLRHTDYVITYIVRQYTDVDEIIRVMKTRPQNLSLNELFLAAQTYTPGSPEYNEVFEIAVRTYPEDPTANLNAANTAISKKDFDAAEKYLSRAGNTPETDYARGVLAAKQKNYDQALLFFEKALKGGIAKSADAISSIKKLQEFKGNVEYINS